jgi:hypothetical protein
MTPNEMLSMIAQLLRERDEATRSLEKERIAINYFIKRGMRERDKAMEQNAKLLEITEKMMFLFSSQTRKMFRAELDKLKEGAK